MLFFRNQVKVRFLGLFIFYAICVFTTTVCSTSTQEVRIGALYPLSNVNSGAENLNGSQWLAGSLMAIHDLNERFANRNIVFKVAVRDTKRTFSNTVFGTFDLVEKVFDKNGSHIVVGAGLNSLTEAIAYVLKDFEVAQIAYASNSTALSHPTLFPYFSRVYPSSSYESSAIADIISNYFDYSRVILIHSSDDYGLDGATQFALAAAKLKISIIATVKIEYFDSSTKSSIEMLSVYDVRVFVLIMSDVHQSGKLILQGSSTGIFSEETVIFSSGSLFTSELWMSLSTDASTISKIMSGLFVISNADDDWKVSPKGQNFIQRFRSLPDTKMLSANGSTVCNNKTDDDGSFYLYQFSVTGSPPYHCTGLSFRKFAADGSDISSFTAYSYDAMLAAGTAVIKYADVHNGGIIPHKINGALLSNFIKSHISVMGYTGYIDFNNGTSGDQFDAGTRKTSVRFKVNNFNIGAGTLKDFALRRVGTWTTEGGFELCGADLTLQSAITGGCTAIRYGTSDNSKPAGQPVTIIEIMPSSMNVTLYSLAALNFLVILLIGFILVVYRNTRLLKASQSSMMWIIVSANIFSVIRTVLASSAPTAGICTASTWMGHLAFMSIVAMFAKTLRIYILVKSGLRKRKVTATQVVSFTMMAYVFLVLYLLLYTFLDTEHVRISESVSITGQITVMSSCNNSAIGLDIALSTLEGIILLATLVLCYSTRDVPDAINEAFNIAPALLLILGVCAIAFTSIYLIQLHEYQKEFTIGICFSIGSVGSMLIYFSGKTILLLSGAELNRNFEIVRNDHLKIMNSTESHMSRTPSFSSDIDGPATAEDCERQIAALKINLTKILARDALAHFVSSSPSLQHAVTFRKAHQRNPARKNDPVCQDNPDKMEAFNSTLQHKFKMSHQVHPTNIPVR